MSEKKKSAKSPGIRKTLRARVLSLLLTAVLILGANTMTAFAVTGSEVAADGEYTSTVTAYKYEDGVKETDKYYTAKLWVEVKDGKISSLSLTDGAKYKNGRYDKESDTIQKYLLASAAAAYCGKDARITAVEDIDTVSSASVADVDTTSSATQVTHKDKYYASNIRQAVIDALSQAPARNEEDSSGSGAVVNTLEGTAEVGDEEGSKIVLQVGVDSDGKIVSLTADSASVGSWDNLISNNSGSYIGKTADQIDSVSGATKYSTALNKAVLGAMSKAGSGSNDVSNPDSDAGDTISKDGTATIYVGETVTLDGEHNSIASGESWSSSDDSIATVEKTGAENDSDAIVTGHSAGTVTITHTISSLFGSSTETFTVIVKGAGSGGGSEGGSGTDSGNSDPATGVSLIKVTKTWANDSESDRPASVTVGIYNGSTKEKTLTLTADSGWTATATGLDPDVSYTVKEDSVEGYTSTVTKGDTTDAGNASGGWTAQSYGNVEAGKTYAFTYESNGTTYLLGRSGTSVIGSTSGLSNGVPAADIGNDYKWEISEATTGTSYGRWLAKNLGNNYYLAPYNGYSTNYSDKAVLQSSNSYYGNVNLHFDDDGSIWNGRGSLMLYASGGNVDSSGLDYTSFTPYLYTEGGTSGATVEYTITNTKESSGGGEEPGGGESGGGDEPGGEDEEPADPAHVKAIMPENKVADNYNITLNVTGQSKTTTSTTQTGESTTSPYDILLVLDNTRSMISSYGDTTRLAAMISAAKSFVNGLPAADGSKIAMVSFTTGNYKSIVTTNVNWRDLSGGKSAVVSAIGGLNAPDTGYDTYFTQPLETASSLLGNVAGDSNKKYVVFFTDGAAAEDLNTIQSLASTVKEKADSTFSIGIVSGSTEENKAKALASSDANYYDVSSAGTMGEGFTKALTTIQSETTVTKVPMTNVSITDTLSDYVELSQADAGNKGVTVTASPEDSKVSVKSVTVDGKAVTVALDGDLTDDTVYTVSIPVKPTDLAQTEANAAQTATSRFNSNADTGVSLTYQYGSETAKTTDYTEKPQIVVAKQVTLTYDANAGEGTAVTGMPDPRAETGTVAAEGDAAGKASFTITKVAPTRTGYKFLGWAEEKESTTAAYTGDDGKNSIEIDKDTTLYAVWSAEHKVTYSVSGEAPAGYEVPEEATVTEGTEVTVAEKPDASGYTEKGGTPGTFTFTGWTTPDSVKVENGKFTMPDQDVELTGVWTFTPDTYTVTWMNGETQLEEDKNVAHNATPSFDGTEPVKAADDDNTYTFKGWAKSTDSTETVNLADEKVTKDVTYYAVFESQAIDKYEVTYKVNGDAPEGYTAPEAQTGLKAGDSVTLAAAGTTEETTKDGINGTWTFEGWTAPEDVTVEDGTFTMPASNVEFTGSWTFTPAKHTVKFVDDDGSEIRSTEYTEGTKAADVVKPADPTKAADDKNTYTFAGWTPDIADVTADATYTATYTATPIPVEQVTVTFDSDGGSAVESQTFDKGGKATEPAAPTRDGFDFAGWKLNGADYDFSSAVNDNITLTASWTEKDDPDEPQPQDDDKYTVNTKITGHTYEIYQIFTGDISTLGEGDDAKEVLTNIVWGQNGTGTTGDAVDQDILDALTAVVGETLDDTKLAVIEKYVTIDGNPLETITADDNEKKSVQLPAGYYLIRDKATTQTGRDDTYTTYITRMINNYEVTPKSAKPTVEKTVEDAAGSFGETADHAIGEEFKFKLTATLTKDEDYAAYETYKVQFEDTMSAGLTFVGLNSIKINGTDVTNSIPADDKTQQKNNDGTTKIVVTVQDVKTSAPNLDLTKTDGVVEVIYTAKLNENAIASNAGGSYGIGKTNTNSVKLKYSNNPNTGGSGDMGQTTTDDNVFVFTYQINNTKMGKNGDEDPTPLAGAGFRLYKADGTTEIPLVYNATKGAYIPSAADADGEEMKSAAETGVFNIAGLDAGNYVLKETTVPKGYNKCDDTNIKISATHEINGDGTSATLTLSNDSTMSTTPINRTGSELPTTGGIGTTIFYTVGGILVLGAGILLITRRRMGNN